MSISPLVFVLGVEILAQRIWQSTSFQAIKLPQSVEVKISQLADDTTLICRDVNELRENMIVFNKFNGISGLELNKEKTKAVWIGSAKNHITKPLSFQPYQEPTKSLGVSLSYNQDRNNNLIFLSKFTDGYEVKYVANERSNFVWSHRVSYVPRHIRDSLMRPPCLAFVKRLLKQYKIEYPNSCGNIKKDSKKSSNISVILLRWCELSKCPHCGKITTLELVRQNFKLYK